jgi:hypothetical protein
MNPPKELNSATGIDNALFARSSRLDDYRRETLGTIDGVEIGVRRSLRPGGWGSMARPTLLFGRRSPVASTRKAESLNCVRSGKA